FSQAWLAGHMRLHAAQYCTVRDVRGRRVLRVEAGRAHGVRTGGERRSCRVAARPVVTVSEVVVDSQRGTERRDLSRRPRTETERAAQGRLDEQTQGRQPEVDEAELPTG